MTLRICRTEVRRGLPARRSSVSGPDAIKLEEPKGGDIAAHRCDFFGLDDADAPPLQEQRVITGSLSAGHSATAIAPFWGQAWSRVCVRRTPSEVWIGASAPPAIDRAARLAEGWIASPSLTREEAHKQADLYRERCAAHGRQPGAIALRRDITSASPDRGGGRAGARASRGYRSMPAEALSRARSTKSQNSFGPSGTSATLTSLCAI